MSSAYEAWTRHGQADVTTMLYIAVAHYPCMACAVPLVDFHSWLADIYTQTRPPVAVFLPFHSQFFIVLSRPIITANSVNYTRGWPACIFPSSI